MEHHHDERVVACPIHITFSGGYEKLKKNMFVSVYIPNELRSDDLVFFSFRIISLTSMMHIWMRL